MASGERERARQASFIDVKSPVNDRKLSFRDLPSPSDNSMRITSARQRETIYVFICSNLSLLFRAADKDFSFG